MAEFTQEQMNRASMVYDFLIEYEKKGQHRGGVGFIDSKGRPLRGAKNDPPLSPAGPYTHGVGGLFSTPGQSPTIFSTHVRPIPSTANSLPVLPRAEGAADARFGGMDAPLYTTVTGFTAGAGDDWNNQPENVCDDAPEGGLMKACTMTAPYGLYKMGIKEINILEVGRLINRGEPTDLRLMNPPLTRDGAYAANPFSAPTGLPFGGTDIINIEVNKRMAESGVSFQRMMARQTWTGNPANNKAGGGAAQFVGFDLIITTGNKVDFDTGVLCPSMDADIKDFAYNLVNGTGLDIVNYVDSMYRFLSKLATDVGLDPVMWNIVMHPDLFDEICKVWPVRYYQEFLAQMNSIGAGQGFLNVEATNSATFRDQMRNGSYLLIRGQQIPVLQDSTVAYQTDTDNANIPQGQYASDIRFIPMTVLGGTPVTYWQYFDFGNSQAQQLFALSGNQAWTTDAGMFAWAASHKNWCIKLQWAVQPRIVCRVPFLSGRIQNVRFFPLQKSREWDPQDPYFVNGGRTNTSIGTYYTEWSPTTPVPIIG